MTAPATTKIANAREYQITLDRIRDFEQSLVAQEGFRAGRDPAEHWLAVGGLEGMLADLCQQAAEYDPADGRAHEATLAAIGRFERYARYLDEASGQLAPALLELMRENTDRFLADLRAQATEYEAARRRTT